MNSSSFWIQVKYFCIFLTYLTLHPPRCTSCWGLLVSQTPAGGSLQSLAATAGNSLSFTISQPAASGAIRINFAVTFWLPAGEIIFV